MGVAGVRPNFFIYFLIILKIIGPFEILADLATNHRVLLRFATQPP
jgi:hypothetical protein